jgi:hypothetical protein
MMVIPDFGILSNNLLLRIFDRPVSPIYMREDEADDFEMMQKIWTPYLTSVIDADTDDTDPDIYSRIEC